MSKQPGAKQSGRGIGSFLSRPSSSVQRRLNLVFLAGLLVIIAVASVAIYLVHTVQIRRNVGSLLAQARQLEAGGHLDQAIDRLSMYVNHRPQDGEAWAHLARLRDSATPETANHELVYETYAQAVRFNPGDVPLTRKLIDLAINLKRFGDARIHLEGLYKEAAGKKAGGSRLAELEDLLGQCDEGELKVPAKADESWYAKAIRHDPTRVDTYARQAHLLRETIKDPGAADKVIEAMVKVNPQSGKAYLTRWTYCQRYGLAGDDKDIDRALELAADDADILLAAAQAAARRNDLGKARRLIEQGLKLYPSNPSFYILSAAVETQDNHLDKAESVLRQGTEAIPSNGQLGFRLTDLLIGRNKLEGPEGAETWIERLRAHNLREGFVAYLDARVLVVRKQYTEAISKLNTARALLASEPTFLGKLNLMLAACYKENGDEESLVAALRQAAASPEPATRLPAQASLARELEKAGQLDEALNLFALLVREEPAATLDLARVTIEATRRLPRGRQRWSEAERRLHAAEKVVPGLTAELALLRAELQAAQEQYPDARRSLEAALQKSPKDRRLWLSLTSILESLGEWAEARKTLDRAERELGGSVELTLARITELSRQGGDDAKKALVSLAATFAAVPAPDRPRLLDAEAFAWLRLGDRQRARQAWRTLVKEQPGDRRVLGELCELAIEAGDHSEARQLVTQIRSAEGEEGTQWRYTEAILFIDLARRGDAAAQRQVDRLIGEIALRRGDWWGVSVLKGQLAEAQDRLDDAINHYLEAVQRGDTQPALARRALALLYRMQRFDQIDPLVATLASRGLELEDMKLATAVNAMRRRDFDRAVAIAGETIPEASTNPFDHITLGQIFQSAGRTQEAGKAFRRALELGPKVPAAWLAQVRFLVETGQSSQARLAVEQARKALPADVAPLPLAQCCLLIGKPVEAESLLVQALAAHPGDPAYLRRLAEFYITQKQKAKAEPLLHGLIETATASDEDKAWARRGLLLLKVQPGSTASIDEALRHVDENLKSNPQSLEDLQAKTSLLAMHPARRSEAITLLESREKSGSLDPGQSFFLAMLYLADGDRPKCQQQLKKLLDRDGTVRNVDHLRLMVQVQLDQGHLAEAERWLAELKKQQPPNLQTLQLEASLLKAQKHDDALLALLQAYARDHTGEEPALASLFEELGFPREAEAACRKMQAENPQDPRALVRLIGFLGRQDRTQEALGLWKQARMLLTPDRAADVGVVITSLPSATDAQRGDVESWLLEALKAQPKSRNLRLKLAYLRIKEGRSGEAEALYRAILTETPSEAEALNNLAELVAYHDGPKDEALSLVNRAIEVAGAVPALLDTRALIYLQMDQPEHALDDLRKALAASPGRAAYHFHMARAYDQSSNPEEARKSFDQAERLGLKLEAVEPMERNQYNQLRQRLTAKH